MKKIVALAGGVGGAKLVLGLANAFPDDDLSVIVNTGDDFNFMGLKICPDIDTICYTLAGLVNTQNGWGRNEETWNFLNTLRQFGEECWFNLGDKDLGLHIYRTNLLKKGYSLTEVTNIICQKLNIKALIFPMCDEEIPTIISTELFGDLFFQEYFVKYKFEPRIQSIRYKDINNARMNKLTEKIIDNADVVILCPSNPWLSILPILNIEGYITKLKQKKVIAVSPIVGNVALKGPAAKIFLDKGINPSAFEIAKIYQGIVSGLVIDDKNENESENIKKLGILPYVTDTIMSDDNKKKILAKNVVQFAFDLL